MRRLEIRALMTKKKGNDTFKEIHMSNRFGWDELVLSFGPFSWPKNEQDGQGDWRDDGGITRFGVGAGG